MKTPIYLTIILTFIILNASTTAAINVVTSSQASFSLDNSTKSSVKEAESQDAQSIADSKNLLRVYTASGKTENLTIPFEKYTLSAFSYGNNSSIFINDLQGGDKIDVQLRNYTLLLQEGYLRDDDTVRVIALTGNSLKSDTYAIQPLNEQETISLSNIVQGLNGTIVSRYTALPYVAAEMPYEEVSAFSRCNMISHVFLDRKCKVRLSESVPIIKPKEKWQQVEDYFGFQINGTGVRIAILDTGIDKTHPDLQNKVILEKCFTDEGKTSDGYGHGTHCASIATGTGAASGYTYVGVAPGAVLLNGKVLTDGGWGYDSWIIGGIEWAVEQNAQVISMSFGNSNNGDGTDPMSMAVDWATDQGAVCAVAAGNSGVWGMFSVGSPAVARKVITVGATTKTDEMAYFSSQGPTLDYRLKPDVCAPGVDIVAARAAGTSMGSPVNEYYTTASGTSMATPHVAGAAALILQAHPDWTPVMVKSALMGNSKILNSEHSWRQGAGRIDVCDATNTTLLVTEPSASFGVIKYGSSTNTTFTLLNTAGSPQAVNLSTATVCEGVKTDYVRLNVSSLTIPAHGSAHVLMTVGPMDENAPEGWYEGWFNVTGKVHGCRAPYLFIVRSVIQVSMYDVDNSTHIAGFVALVNYPDMSFVGINWLDASSPYTSFFVKGGNYSICVQCAWVEGGNHVDFSRTFIMQKTFSAQKFSTTYVNISLAEAFTREIPTVDSQGKNLTIHTYTQYFCGQSYHPLGIPMMYWSTQCIWSGFELNVSKLTLYSTEYSSPDELSEDFGYYASNDLQSEVYLVNWKFTNVPILPAVITQDYSKLAKYNVYYDMPETYPEYSLNTCNAFWFTWEHIGAMQTWGLLPRRVHAGINATFYLTPTIAWYWGYYMTTYSGWPSIYGLLSGPFWGPVQQWSIRDWNMPPSEREKGKLVWGRFDFGPYAPGINIRTQVVNNHCVINLAGDLWSGLDWPHLMPDNYYPIGSLPYYILYVDGHVREGNYLMRFDEYGFVYWDDLSYSWEVEGERATLQIFMPSLATISKQTIYTIDFSLTKNQNIPPFFYRLLMPLKYDPNENITIQPKIPSVVGFHLSNISLSYSFDNTTVWHVAQASPTQAFTVPCQPSDQLAIQINAEDDAGNTFQYYSNPVALCKRIKLDKTTVGSSTIIEATTLNGQPIGDVALRIGTTISSFYAPLNSLGQVVLPTSIGSFKAWFPEVGLYARILVPKPDVAVVDIVLSADEVYVGRTVDVYVTVKNLGEFPESFSVKAYCGVALIGVLAADELEPAMTTTLTFTFNTTVLVPYVDYAIKAEASFITYEANMTNDVLVKGNLRARALGDVNDDRKIDILDIVQIAGAYGSRKGDPNWKPFADLTQEWGKIDILDVVTCACHYGEKY